MKKNKEKVLVTAKAEARANAKADCLAVFDRLGITDPIETKKLLAVERNGPKS